MSNTNQSSSSVSWNPAAVLRDIVVAWKLLWDPQVSTLLKLSLPVLALVYWISPIDLLPGMPFDDLAVIIVAARLFVNMAPPAAVERALKRRTRGRGHAPDDDSIDATWRIVDD